MNLRLDAAHEELLGSLSKEERRTKTEIVKPAINPDHPLSDGSKRLSWLVAKGFLALNGHDLVADSVQEGNALFGRSPVAGSSSSTSSPGSRVAQRIWPDL